MGQSFSTPFHRRLKPPFASARPSAAMITAAAICTASMGPARDHTADFPDGCLGLIFPSLGSGDRKRCSLVCRRWLAVEGQSHHRLALDARAAILEAASSVFACYDAGGEGDGEGGRDRERGERGGNEGFEKKKKRGIGPAGNEGLARILFTEEGKKKFATKPSFKASPLQKHRYS